MRLLAETLPEQQLFTPGPVMVPDEVRESASAPAIGHRRPPFEEVLDTVRDQILDVYNADDRYTSVVVSGSGTAANETVINSLHDVTPLVVVNGEFGERLTRIMDAHGVDYRTLEYEWGERPVPADVEAVLDAAPEIDLVAMTYQETSTGMLNPVAEVGEICADRDCFLYADCISAVGGEPIDVCEEHVDIATGVSNKAVAGLTGSSFVCLNEAVLDAFDLDARTTYLDLDKHVRYAKERSQTPNTPAVTSILGLNAALAVLLEREGLDERVERHRRCSAFVRDGIEAHDELELLLPREQSSSTVTSVFLPDGVDLESFIDALAQRGYLVYAGKGPYYDRGMFQISTMGEIYLPDCREFMDVLDDVVAVARP
ncbi:MAG: alanine--glyoxylate aminotransferase family protein [Haloferacaceae archaeon]